MMRLLNNSDGVHIHVCAPEMQTLPHPSALALKWSMAYFLNSQADICQWCCHPAPPHQNLQASDQRRNGTLYLKERRSRRANAVQMPDWCFLAVDSASTESEAARLRSRCEARNFERNDSFFFTEPTVEVTVT